MNYKKLFDDQNTDSLLALQIFSVAYLKHMQMIDDHEFITDDLERIFSMD